MGDFQTVYDILVWNVGNNILNWYGSFAGVKTLRPSGMDQRLHLRRYFRPAIAKMRIMEPFFGTVLQFAQCYAGTVKMQSIDDNSYILPAGGSPSW